MTPTEYAVAFDKLHRFHPGRVEQQPLYVADAPASGRRIMHASLVVDCLAHEAIGMAHDIAELTVIVRGTLTLHTYGGEAVSWRLSISRPLAEGEHVEVPR